MANTEQALNKAREALEFYANKDEWQFLSNASHWQLVFNSKDCDGHGWEVAERALSAIATLTAASAEAQPSQEHKPAFAWYLPDDNGLPYKTTACSIEASQWRWQGKTVFPLYTHPQPSAPVAQQCVCGNPTSGNTVHRTDGPCYQAERHVLTEAGKLARIIAELREAACEFRKVSEIELATDLDNWANRLDALSTAPQVEAKEGWKLVPVEPTDAMIDAAMEVETHRDDYGHPFYLSYGEAKDAWEKMLSAAPSSQKEGEQNK